MSSMMVPSSKSWNHFDNVGRGSLRGGFELVWQRKCKVDDSLGLVYCFLGKIREDRWDLAVFELVDKFRCFVGILRRFLRKLLLFERRRTLTRLLSHVSVAAISSSRAETLL